MDNTIALVKLIQKEFSTTKTQFRIQSQPDHPATQGKTHSLKAHYRTTSHLLKLDLKSRSVCDNLNFASIQESLVCLWQMSAHKYITCLDRLRIVEKDNINKRPIKAKFEHYKQKVLVKETR